MSDNVRKMTRFQLEDIVRRMRRDLKTQEDREEQLEGKLASAEHKIGALTSDVETLLKAIEKADAGKRPLTIKAAVQAVEELGKAIEGFSLHRVQVLASPFGGRVVVFQRTRSPDAPWQLKLSLFGRVMGIAGTLPKVRVNLAANPKLWNKG